MCLLLLSSLSKVFFRQQSWSHPRPDGICRYIHGRLVVLIQPMSGLSFKLVQCWCLILLICVTMRLKHFLRCYIKLFKSPKDLRRRWWILVKLREEVVNIWIFVFLAKQNISTDWEPKNSAEKPVQLASIFPLFFSLFSAPLKLLLGFSQQLQKPRENSNVLNTKWAWYWSRDT